MKMNFLSSFACILAVSAALVMSGTEARQGNVAAPPSQSPGEAPGPSTDCATLVVNNMISCMDFLSTTGSETTPDKNCCSGLKVVLDTDADCICYALSNAASFGLDVNMTKAEAMAADCGISSAPPISNCNVTVPSPSPSPVNPPPVSPPPSNPPNLPPTNQPPAASPSGNGGGSPSPSRPGSGASTITATFSVIFTSLVSFTLFFKALA